MTARNTVAETAAGTDLTQLVCDAVANGDMNTAARLLMEHLGPRLRGVLLRLDPANADDLWIESIMATLESIKKRRPKSISAYLYAVAHYKCYALHRSFWYRVFRDATPYDDFVKLEHGGFEALSAPGGEQLHVADERDELVQLLPDLLKSLSQEERIILAMTARKVPDPEIGIVLRRPANTVAQMRSRARKKLKKLLAEWRSAE